MKHYTELEKLVLKSYFVFNLLTNPKQNNVIQNP